MPGYYHKYGFKSPEDSKNAPYTFAHNAVDKDFFDLLVKDEEKLKFFNEGMTIMAVLGLKPLGSLYPFDKLKQNEEGVALVDIGGGKGQMLKAIQEAYPTMEGKLVLQDLGVVLKGGVVVGESVKLMPYDFFKDVQPIKGELIFPLSMGNIADYSRCELFPESHLSRLARQSLFANPVQPRAGYERSCSFQAPNL